MTSTIVYATALGLGVVMLLSVCYVYVRHQVLQMSGIGLAGFAVILVGMSVWKSIDISVNAEGIVARLAAAEKKSAEASEQAAKAKAEAEAARSQTIKLKTEALQLRDTFAVFTTQVALRDKGLYKGPLDGRLSQATKASLQQFQKLNKIPTTRTLDKKTLEALKLAPTMYAVVPERRDSM